MNKLLREINEGSVWNEFVHITKKEMIFTLLFAFILGCIFSLVISDLWSQITELYK